MSGSEHPLSFRESLSGRAVLVTGAAGFIGAALCRELVSAEAVVHATTRRPAGITSSRGLTVHQIDVADGPSVDRLVAAVEPEVIFHLASRVSGSRSMDEVLPTFSDNLASTVHLLRAATGTQCKRIILAGSLEESASTLSNSTPSSPYAVAKSAASAYARMFHGLYGTPVTIARLFMVYGPGQNDGRKLVPYVATSLLKGQTPRLTSGVRPVDWVYIDDVVDALIRLAITPGLEGKTVDVGTGRLTSVRSVAEQIGKLVGGMTSPVFGAVEDRANEQVRAADPHEAAELLGRTPIELEEGLRRTVAWYRARESASHP